MQQIARLFRLAATAALTALLWDAALPVGAVAQPAPPPLPALGKGRPDLSQGDPPERVGRIAGMTGTVSFHNLGDTQWSAATPNYPVSSGNAFWTEPSSEAQLEVSACRIAMAGSTEFDVTTLDVSGLQGVTAQGEVYLHLPDLGPNEVWSIQTPRGLVRLSVEGRYEIVVGTTDQPTLITAVDGSAQIDGPGVSLRVAANQTATITGTDSFQGSVGSALRDAFLTERLDAERPPRAPTVAMPAEVVAMPGGSDLIGTGSWTQAPDYGQVWYPPVPATWVPYREGHWAYVAPWGWTWVDDAAWGFAPFHYGRWVQIGGRWAWTPGAVARRPVYAPALVSFIGIGAGMALGAALASGSIGWVPLGPREDFHPWYQASNNYVRQVNVSHVTNIRNNSVTINNYVNRAAATSMPAAAMTASRPVQAVARPVTAQELAAAHPILGQQPIRPTAATAGVTPVVARQLNLAPTAVAHPAPGPVVRARAGGTGFARPAFAPAAGRPGGLGGSGVRPAEVTTPEPGRPGAAAPIEPHPGQPNAIRPEAVPGVPHSAGPAVQPGPNVAPAPQARPAPQPQGRPAPEPSARAAPQAVPAVQHPEPQRAVPTAPHPEPPPAAPAVARPEPPRPAPAAVRPELQHIVPIAPHPEPPHPAPFVPHSEPPHSAPVAVRPEPQHAAAPLRVPKLGQRRRLVRNRRRVRKHPGKNDPPAGSMLTLAATQSGSPVQLQPSFDYNPRPAASHHRRAGQLLPHPRGQYAVSLGGNAVGRRRRDRGAGIRGTANVQQQRDLAQKFRAQPGRLGLRPAVAENLGAMAAVRTTVEAHVFNQTENRHLGLLEHAHPAARVDQGNVLRR